MIGRFVTSLFKKFNKKSLDNRQITGTLTLVIVLTILSYNLSGKLLKNVSDKFDYGIYYSKIDGITNNMGCATIVGKSEKQGLACMQNLFNKCNSIKLYTFLTNLLLILSLILLVFNNGENETNYKIVFFCTVLSLIFYLIINYYTYVMKENDITDENCGLKNIDQTEIKYGISFYINLSTMVILVYLVNLMYETYKKILH